MLHYKMYFVHQNTKPIINSTCKYKWLHNTRIIRKNKYVKTIKKFNYKYIASIQSHSWLDESKAQTIKVVGNEATLKKACKI